MRIFAAVLLIGLVAGATCAAAEGESENGRFSFKEVPDGVLKLDSRTGQVSLCSRIGETWACRMLPDDRVALEDEIGRLVDANAALKKELEARRSAAPGEAPRAEAPPAPNPPAPPQAAPKSGERDFNLPSDKDVDRMMAFLEKMWRRLLDMAQRAQREFDQDHRQQQKDGI
jgi:hypothetical protein